MLLNGATRMVVVDDAFPAVRATTHEVARRIGAGGQRAAVVTGSGYKTKDEKRLQQLAPVYTDVEPTWLCSHSFDPGELWVALFEKAFIKVCGGSYDFPGSNSSTDLFRLSGWLPDVITLPGGTDSSVVLNATGEKASAAPPFDSAQQWTRLSTCHSRGAVVLTANTSANLSPTVQQKLKLIPGHAYAVLEFRTTMEGGHQLVKIKNPWAKQSWEGLFSLADDRRCTESLLAELSFTKEESEAGVFWMSWQDVSKFFSKLHLSWNPYALFPGPPKGALPASFAPSSVGPSAAALAMMSTWQRPVRVARHAVYQHGFGPASQPQFLFSVRRPSNAGAPGIPTKARMHLVLARHVLDANEFRINFDNIYVPSKKPTGPDDGAGGGGTASGQTCSVPYLALHVYNVTGLPSLAQLAGRGGVDSDTSISSPTGRTSSARRLQCGLDVPDACLVHKGIYRNVAHQTVSFDVPLVSSGNNSGTNLVASGRGVGMDQNDSTAAEMLVVVSQHVPPEEAAAMPSVAPFISGQGDVNRQSYQAMISQVAPSFPFTLLLHTGLPLSLVALTPLSPTSLKYATEVFGKFVRGVSCGGRPSMQTFVYNPQYSFTLRKPSHVMVRLETPMSEAVNLFVARLRAEEETIGFSATGASTVKKPPPSGNTDASIGNGMNADATLAGVPVCPWRGRLAKLTGDDATAVYQCPKYIVGCASVDPSLRACIGFAAHIPRSALENPTSPAASAPTPLRPCLEVVLSAAVPTGDSKAPLVWDVGFHPLPIDVQAFACVAGMAGTLPEPVGILCSPLVSRVVPRLAGGGGGTALAPSVVRDEGSATTPSQPQYPMSSIFPDAWSPARIWGGPAASRNTVLLEPMSDSLQRTVELTSIERNLLMLARAAMTTYHRIVSPAAVGNDTVTIPKSKGDEELEITRLNELVLQETMKLDASHLPTDAVRHTRKVLVHAANAIHKVLDVSRAVLRLPAEGRHLPPPPPAASSSTAIMPSLLSPIAALPAGRYTIVPSCWKRGVPGPFRITLECEEEALEVNPITPEGQGWPGKERVVEAVFNPPDSESGLRCITADVVAQAVPPSVGWLVFLRVLLVGVDDGGDSSADDGVSASIVVVGFSSADTTAAATPIGSPVGKPVATSGLTDRAICSVGPTKLSGKAAQIKITTRSLRLAKVLLKVVATIQVDVTVK